MTEKIEINDIISEIFIKEKKDFIRLSEIKKSLSKSVKKQLGLTKSNISTKSLKNALEPHLKDNFVFYKKMNILYIAENISPLEIIMKNLSNSIAKSPKDLSRSLPFSKNEFITALNSLLNSDKIKITLTEKYEPRIHINNEKNI